MKTIALIMLLGMAGTTCLSQSIIGKWQLTRQSTCVEADLDDDDDEMAVEMRSMRSPGAQVIQFKENNTAEENTKIINSRKNYNSKALLYKYTGDALYILDKRSKTIIEAFTVEQLSADSLIISNTARACETKVFVKIN